MKSSLISEESVVLTRKKQNILNNIIFIDGFSGSGKSLIASIFGYLERTEFWQLDSRYEYISTFYYLGKLSEDAAHSMLQMTADNHIYDLMLSRYVNFRRTDQSSPYYGGLEKKYLDRLSKEEGNSIIEDVKTDNPILPIHLHALFGYTDVLFSAYKEKLKLYMIVLRNPFDLIKFWLEGDWVNRIGNDDRDFQFCIEKNEHVLPWYTVEYSDAYVMANELEKSILTVFNYYNRVFSAYKNSTLSKRKKILFIEFEKFIVEPNSYIDKICNILGTPRGNDFNSIMARLDLPRKNIVKGFFLDDFLKMYTDRLSVKYINLLHELDERYNEFIKK